MPTVLTGAYLGVAASIASMALVTWALLAALKRLFANPAAATELGADELAKYRAVTVADLEAML